MKYLILIALFLFGCKEYVEDDMTISVPTSLELVSTNVIDDTQIYSPTAWYADGDEVQSSDKIYAVRGTVPIDWYDHYEPIDGDIILKSGTYYDVINTYIDESPNASNTLIYTSISDYILDIEAFDPVTNYCKPIGPSDTVCFTYVSGETWTKTTSGPYGGSADITIFETWRENMEDQQYFFHNGNLYRRYETQDSVANTRFYKERIDIPSSVQTLEYIRPVNELLCFDNQNYTPATITTQMTYTIKGLVKFDTLSLGRVKADSATITFTLPATSPNYDLWLDGIQVASGGNGVVTTITRTIDASRDDAGDIEDWYTTEIFYSDITMEIDSTVDITLDIATGETVELGTILLGQSVNAGYSNLAMNHSYKDFSVAEYDAWGNLDYVERQRILTYEGSVDVDITNYDKTVRLMRSLGKQLVIVNGSTSKTTVPDSLNVFASTQIIGRFMSFRGRTKVKNDALEEKAEYSFVLEELA